MTTTRRDDHLPSVSVIIPCRNEAEHIEACLGGIGGQDLTGIGSLEVLVADGRSDDGTREIVARWTRRDPRFTLVDNPERVVSTGLNRAIDAARGDIVIRVDAHTELAADYLRRCVEVLARTGAQNVGGPWVAVGQGYLGRAIALAFQSPFAVGAARGHDPRYEGDVDTVYLGCWRRRTLLDLGLFDADLVRNQDDELNLRLRRAGGRIWQSPAIRSAYRVRGTLRGLFRQYLQYGYWKVGVIHKHRQPASPRHLVPFLFVLALALGWLPVLWWTDWWGVYATGVGLYAVLVGGASVAAVKGEWALLPVLPLVIATFHLAYGLGFALGIWDHLRGRGAKRVSMTRLTRASRRSAPRK